MQPTRLSPFFLLCLLALNQAAWGKGVNLETGEVVLALRAEPRTFNPLRAESISYTAGVMILLQEGLMRYDRRRRLAGGVAESWQVDEYRMTFQLRKDATWSNGDPVTAHDFVLAFQQLVSPDTAPPSASLASPILNASAVLVGNKPATALGVKANGDRELIVELAHPCGWCLKLMTNSIFYPVHQQSYLAQGDAYGTSDETHMSNGMFVIDTWQRGRQLSLVRRAGHWDKQAGNVRRINFNYIGIDSSTSLNLFRSGELAVAFLDRNTVNEAVAAGLSLKTYPSGHLFNIQFSHRPGMTSANQNIRRAIALVVDRNHLVDRVVGSPGTRVAHSMFHDWLTVDRTRILSARPVDPQPVDVEAARELLLRGRQQLGLEGELVMTLTIDDSDTYQRVAEYLQARLKQTLDIRLRIDAQTTQMMVNKWRRGETEMTLLTWPVDVDDPMDQISFLGNPEFRKVFTGVYAGDDMAAIYYQNRDALQLEARLDAVMLAHRFFTDKATVLPLFEAYGATVIRPELTGWVWQPVRGYADYRYVSLPLVP